MSFIAVVNRQQMQLSSMEDAISQDNIVRFVDAFVEKLDIEKLGLLSLIRTFLDKNENRHLKK